MESDLKLMIRSTVLWALGGTLMLFLFLTFGARPALRLLGMLFGLMGGQGLEGSGL